MLNALKQWFKPVESPPAFDLETRAAGYDKYQQVVTEEIRLSRSGELNLSPIDLWLQATQNCNLFCIGCWAPGKFHKVNMSVDEARKLLTGGGPYRYISLTSGEAFLNPQLCDIIELCKELHPEAKVWVISNGQIPLKGRYRRAMELTDRLGLSIDGSTKETFEAIRKGSNFERFIEVSREAVKIRSQTGSPEAIVFSFTATATNLHELAGVVRIASDLGVPEIWAQVMENKDERVAGKVAPIHLDTMDPALRTKHIEAAKAEAARLGVRLGCSEGLDSRVSSPVPGEDADRSLSDVRTEIAVRMCRYPWREPFVASQSAQEFNVVPCCYISGPKASHALKRYGLTYSEPPGAGKVYNSEGFWKFREDLAAGRASDICGKCSAARHYAWRPEH